MTTGELPAETKEPRTTTRGAIVLVGAALVLLFILISFWNQAYRTTRRSRAEGRYSAGVQMEQAGKSAQAVQDFRDALVYEHDDPKYRLALAKALIGIGRWEEAEGHLRELEERDPTNGPINEMLARLADRAGDYDEAVDDYNRAIYGYWPDHPEENRISTRLELIGVLDEQGLHKQVLAELLALAGEVPDTNVGVKSQIAGMLLAHHWSQHAAEAYRAILSAHRHDAAAEQGLGEAEFQLGDFAAARKTFRMAEHYGAKDPELTKQIALCDEILDLDPTLVRLNAKQRYQRAEELLRRSFLAVSSCTAIPQDLADAVQKSFAAKPKRRGDDDTANTLTLAQELWDLRKMACAQKPSADQALTAVMTKIAQQQ